MQLVYLYVEDCKNIKNQGFNFSSRFNCAYDKDKQELTIEENKNYIPNFFGENIEVTAIVGENGAGKSSVLEVLTRCLGKEYHPEDFDSNDFIKFILLYKINNQWKLRQTILDSRVKVKGVININQSTEHSLLAENSDLIGVGFYGNNFSSALSKHERLSFESSFLNNEKAKKVIIENKIISTKFSFQSTVDGFFEPQKISLKINKRILFGEDEEHYEKEVWDNIQDLGAILKNNIENSNYANAFDSIIKILELKSNRHKKIPFYSPKSNTITSLKLQYKYNIKPQNLNDIAIPPEMLFKNMLEKLPAKKLANDVFYEWDVRQINAEVMQFLWSLPESVFSINIYDENKSFNELSFGERQLIIYANYILYYLIKESYQAVFYIGEEDEQEVIDDINIKNTVILFDELEIGMHPEWQKKFFSYLWELLNSFKSKSFHLITTTHSPFILSDIPNQNIVFLKGSKQVNAFDKKNTFGANIHTLLSDGFFMQDGLMGEFAENKIEEVVKFLNGKPSEIKSTEDAQKIINVIGEPILKRELQRMLDSKRLNKIDKIDELEGQIELLKNRIDILRKRDE